MSSKPMEGWKRVLRLQGSSEGPYVQVDESAVTASWMDAGSGKKMVKLIDGQVFEVEHTADIPAEPEVDKIKLKSSDGVEFEVDWAAARKSPTIVFTVKSSRPHSTIPVVDVDVKSKILEKVLDYCYKYKHVLQVAAAAAANIEELKRWDADFVKVDLDTLYHLVKAARCLYIDGLEDLACEAIADIIEGKMPEEIRAMFNINKDMTPEEGELAVRELHACTSSLEDRELIRQEDRRDWMDIVNSKFCNYYMLNFY